ncbi:MAG TPA: hypothetical protein VIS56_00915 [Candidatus Saccharimonadales bacterium]
MDEATITDLKQFIATTVSQQTFDLKQDIAEVKQRLTGVEDRLTSVEGRLTSVEEGLIRVDQKIDDLSAALSCNFYTLKSLYYQL